MKPTALPKLVPLLVMVAALVAFAACGDDDDDTAATPATGGGATENPAAASPTTAATAPTGTGTEDGPTVTVGDIFFNPDSLTVKAGETVRWVWSGSLPHSVRLEDETSPTHTC